MVNTRAMTSIRSIMLAWMAISTISADPCPHECICTEANQPVSCSSNLTSIPTLPGHTYWIDLRGNQIESIRAGDFLGLPNLQYLTLVNNSIRFIEVGAFSGLARLSELDVSDNNFAVLTPSHFAGLDNLRYLYISNNNELYLEPCSLSALPSLERIHASHTSVNFSTELFLSPDCPDGTFPPLEYTFIQGSNTDYLDSTLFSRFNSTLTGLGIGQQGVDPESVIDTLAVAPRLYQLILNELPSSLCHIDIDHLVDLHHLHFLRTGFVPDIHHGSVDTFVFADSNVPHIPARAFGNMTYLRYLSLLRNTKLQYINVNALERFTHLKGFTLTDSNVPGLPDGLFAHNPISNIQLRNNRWSCDCHMAWLVEFLDGISTYILETCSSPANLAGRRIVEISEEERRDYCPTLPVGPPSYPLCPDVPSTYQPPPTKTEQDTGSSYIAPAAAGVILIVLLLVIILVSAVGFRLNRKSVLNKRHRDE